MAIDAVIPITHYMLATPLQLFFIDVNTQQPLSGGKLYFYRDADQITPKDVYKYTGTPGNPSFLSLGSVITLTAQGTPGDDQGNDILYFYLPYDADGKWDPYYVVVKDMNGQEQFTRSAIPFPEDPAGGGGTTTSDNYNYINNGQFLLHSDIAADDTHVAGEITQPITTIAYGNWTFQRPNTSASKDTVVFDRFASWVATPESNPRYAVTVTCITPNPGDGFKDIRFRIPDVNMFSGKTVTFTFEGQSNSGSSVAIIPGYFRFHGTGAPTESAHVFPQINVAAFYQSYSTTMAIDTNEDHPLGTLNDDYIDFFIRLPVANASNASFTNFSLLIGNFTAVIYVPQTPQEVISRTLAGVMKIPAYDGSDIGGVLRLAKDAINYDGDPDGVVKWYAGNPASLPPSHLKAMGDKFLTTGTSLEGIAYKRLYNAIGIQWGNGYDYLSAWTVDASNLIRINNNMGGAVTAATDGDVPTTFTISVINAGVTPNIGVSAAYKYNTNTFILKGLVNGPGANPPDPHTSGFTFNILQAGNDLRPWITSVTIPSAPAAGTYFGFYSPAQQYVWYQKDGAGTDPAPGGTGHLVNYLTGDSLFDIVLKTCAVMNQAELTYITAKAASTLTGGEYINVYAAGASGSETHMVFYVTISGSGTNPKIGGATNIAIPLNGSETDIQVAAAFGIAVNNAFFQVPDVRGRVIMGIPFGADADPDSIYRHSNNLAVWGEIWGTYGEDFIADHQHNIPYDLWIRSGPLQNADLTGAGSLDGTSSVYTANTGRYRNMMLNAGMTPIIKY